MTEPETQRIGDYEILGVLGAGGMGQVFKVRNLISDRIEAMKIILPDLAGRQDLADRFLREIKLLAGLNHPNIAALRTALTVNNQLVMIMEYVEGTSLAERLEHGPLSVPEAVNYTGQVLQALSYAHARDIIHRDIKPSNMMLTPEGVVKLMDFGIARSGNNSDLTATGAALGSLYYMPPEQVKGQPTDARSDLYSVGASLYEMVTGERPFRADSSYSLMAAQVQQPPKPPIEVRPDLPPAMSDLILTAMAKEPSQRFQSAAAFQNALNSLGISSSASVAADTAQTAARAAAMTVTSLAATPVPTKSATGIPATGLPPAPRPEPPAIPSVLALSPPRGRHQGLYMALGGLAVLVCLVVAGVYLPRKDKARAGERTTNSAPSQAGDTIQPQPASPNLSSSPTSTPAPIPPSIPATGDVGAAPQNQPSNESIGQHIRKAGSNTKMAGGGQVPGGASEPPQPPPPDNSAALAELEEQVDQLSSRTAAVNDSLDTLRRQQNAQGLGLRGDMAATQERLKIHVGRAQAALQDQDIKNAKRYADQAEAELEQLERFLGR
jgi:serine/threonine-protein kinase